MLELGVGADIFRMVGGFFWVMVIGALLAAIFLPKTRKGTIIAVSVVLTLFAAFPGRWAWHDYQIHREYQKKLSEAKARFNERCKTAGVKIHRTVENVEGIFLMKLRPEKDIFSDQFSMDDPYGRDSGGERYIMVFFSGFYQTPSNPPPGWTPRLGYHYVEAIDPKDGQRYRYTGEIREVEVKLSLSEGSVRNTKFVLDKAPSPDTQPPRYGVTYDDISTREDREYWIAGSSLKVIDLKTNEVMAERIGYMMDRGQGNTSGGRSPWLSAASNACPRFGPSDARQPGFSYQSGQTHEFVTNILKPKLEH